MNRHEVIVIGAGAAGLAATRILSQHNRSVLILEARDRIGGRILTVRDPQFEMPVELGAEFIHGRPHATWELVREAGLKVYDLPFDIWQRRNGCLVNLPDFSDELNKVMGGLAHLRRDVSFAEYLRGHRLGRKFASARRLAIAFVQGFDAADPHRVSAKSLAKEQEDLGDIGGQMQFRLLEGYAAMIEYLRRSFDSNRVKIRLDTPVTEIRWEKGKVEVRTQRRGRAETFVASRIIVTLPLGVLQLPPEIPGSVRFAPDIPHKRRAMTLLASGPVVKGVFKFREAFWEQTAVQRAAGADERLKDMAFVTDPGGAFPTWWTPRPLRLPILTAWAGGPKAIPLSGQSKRTIIDTAMNSLSDLLHIRKARLRSLLHRAHVYDWPADPFARGAYTYVTVGGNNARGQLAKPIGDTLFFAGEATDISGQASTVAGALVSGRRAADEVLDSMS